MDTDLLHNFTSTIPFLISFVAPNAISGIINLIIGIFLAISFLMGISHIKRYKNHEKKSLEKARKNVSEHLSTLTSHMATAENENEKSDGKGFPDLLIDVDELKAGLDSESIICQRIDTISNMRKFRVKVNVDVLQHATLTSEASKLGITLPSFTMSLSMILGLFGTFIGLALMVTKISLLLPNPDALDLSASILMNTISDMDTVFQGISTAFSTSIVGIGSAIFCLYISFQLTRNQTAFLHELDIFTAENLLPVTVPAVEEEHLLEEVSFEVRNSFEQLNAIFNKNTKIIEELNAIENSFKTIISSIREITDREESRNFEGVLGHLAETNLRLTQITSSWPDLIKVMQNYAQDNRSNMESFTQMIDKQQELLKEQIEKVINSKTGGVSFYLPSLRNYGILISLSAVIGAVLYVIFS